MDSSKVLIDNNKGPGASCHIFIYYKKVALEASDMVTRLGKLVTYRYDKDLVAEMFNLEHFKGNKDYKWLRQWKFSTPLVSQIKSNYCYDNNLQTINILNELEQKEEVGQTKEAEKDSAKGAMIINKGHTDKEKKASVVQSVMEKCDIVDDKSESSLTTTRKI